MPIADEWHSALALTGTSNLEPSEVHQRLLALTEQAVAILSAEAFDVEQARQIGARVAQLGYVQPEALGATLDVLGQQLHQLATANESSGPRLLKLLSGIATGFSEQARATARTEAEAARQRLGFLAEVSTQVAASLDLRTTLERVARAAVPVLADWCTLNIADPTGALQTETTAHVNPVQEELAKTMRQTYPRRQESGRSPAVQVLESGATRIIANVDDRLLEQISVDADHLQMWKALAPRAVMIVPLVAHGRSLGTMSLIMTDDSGRSYAPADRALAEDVGRRAAMAVENAQLYTQTEQAVRARDEFLSVAAHELKTPVTSLRGFAQLTLRTLNQNGQIDVERLKRALKVVDQQSDKLTRLVAQLLDVSRVQSGKLALDRQDVDLSALLVDLVASIRTQSDKHELRAVIPPEMRAKVDPLRIEQVLTNLLDNAIKYSPDGGAVDVELSSSNDDPASVVISVRDRGIGIHAEDRERIFERFYQADVGSYHGAGMGLGLYISREIVDLHGGQIRAEFPEDGGSRFVVTLPRR